MSLIGHWLAYRDRWKDSPKVITPRDDADVAEWRRLGYRVEGPFVPADQLAGAVDDLITAAAAFERRFGGYGVAGEVREPLARALDRLQGGSR